MLLNGDAAAKAAVLRLVGRCGEHLQVLHAQLGGPKPLQAGLLAAVAGLVRLQELHLHVTDKVIYQAELRGALPALRRISYLPREGCCITELGRHKVSQHKKPHLSSP